MGRLDGNAAIATGAGAANARFLGDAASYLHVDVTNEEPWKGVSAACVLGAALERAVHERG